MPRVSKFSLQCRCKYRCGVVIVMGIVTVTGFRHHRCRSARFLLILLLYPRIIYLTIVWFGLSSIRYVYVLVRCTYTHMKKPDEITPARRRRPCYAMRSLSSLFLFHLFPLSLSLSLFPLFPLSLPFSPSFSWCKHTSSPLSLAYISIYKCPLPTGTPST